MNKTWLSKHDGWRRPSQALAKMASGVRSLKSWIWRFIRILIILIFEASKLGVCKNRASSQGILETKPTLPGASLCACTFRIKCLLTCIGPHWRSQVPPSHCKIFAEGKKDLSSCQEGPEKRLPLSRMHHDGGSARRGSVKNANMSAPFSGERSCDLCCSDRDAATPSFDCLSAPQTLFILPEPQVQLHLQNQLFGRLPQANNKKLKKQ